MTTKKEERREREGLLQGDMGKRLVGAAEDFAGALKDAFSRADARGQARIKALYILLRGMGALLLGWLFGGCTLSYGTRPLGLALLAAGDTYRLPLLIGCALSGIGRAEGGLYLAAAITVFCVQTAAVFLLTPREESDGDGRRTEGFGGTRADGGLSIHSLQPLFSLFGGGLSVSQRVAVSMLAFVPPAAGWLLGDGFSVPTLVRLLFLLLALPAFTYLFCGLRWEGDRASFFDRRGTRASVRPAHREAAMGALCYAVTASMGGMTVLGFSAKLICAHGLTLYISKKGGYLRGALCGLLCGLACDALYAPGYALIGGVAGLLWQLHPAPAVVLSLASGMAYAVYVGEFAAIRSVVPEMIAVSALAYPAARYLHLHPKKKGDQGGDGKDASTLSEDGVESEEAPTPALLGVPTREEQLEQISGVLGGLSETFSHLSGRARKPHLSALRGACEAAADKHCALCPRRTVCMTEDKALRAEALGKMTMCILRRGRAESVEAYAPLSRRCPTFSVLLEAVNGAAAALYESRMRADRMEMRAADYDGMAKLLRAAAEAGAEDGAEDVALSRRMARTVGKLGFSARHIGVYGKRRRTVIARGVSLGTYPGEQTLLCNAELGEAFSALAGVRYQSPTYHLSAGGEELLMTLHPQPAFAVSTGTWGEKKPGEAVSGDVLSLFSTKSDYFYTILCDGMGSGEEASVTAQMAALFLEKLLSVSAATGPILTLLNNVLRGREEECSATVDLCAFDLLTGEARFTKCGAAPTFLLRGESLYRIASETMPLGILCEVTAEETVFRLQDGDMLVFLSDGILDGDDRVEADRLVSVVTRAWQKAQGRRAVSEAVSETDEADPADMENMGGSPLDRVARAIGEDARARGGRADDRTVVVVRVTGIH